MTFSTSAPPPEMSLGDAFIRFLTMGDFDELATMFEPDAILEVLLPDGLRTWRGPEGISRAFALWFGSVDRCELLDSNVGRHGPRLKLRWRVAVQGGHFGDAWFLVEQHAYADTAPTGRLEHMSMLCSGFVHEPTNV